MPTLICPVCRTENDSTRLFCRKCAADLHATALYQGQAAPPAAAPVPIKPIFVGAGVAAVVIAVVLGVLFVLGGSGGPAPSPTPAGTPAPTAATPPTAGPTLTPTAAATPVAATAAPTPTANTGPAPTPTEPPPIIRFFTGPPSVDCSNPNFTNTIHLSWRVGNADGANLAIDGPGTYKSYVGVLREDDVPFSCDGTTHRYILTTFGGTGPVAEKDLVIGPAPTP